MVLEICVVALRLLDSIEMTENKVCYLVGL